MRTTGISAILVLALGAAAADFAQARTVTVGPGGAYDVEAVQTGIDIADDGDAVLVAPGEYVITEPVTFRGKAITVMSAFVTYVVNILFEEVSSCHINVYRFILRPVSPGFQ
jgi:hypothetical protein